MVFSIRLPSLVFTMTGCPYVRTFSNMIIEPLTFAYKCFNSHLSGLAQKDLPLDLKKRIFRDTLHGIAALHTSENVHCGISLGNVIRFGLV